MRNPESNEKVICPGARNQERLWTPDQVWESTGPTGEKVKYGTLARHYHRFKECEYIGLPVKVVDTKGK